MADARAPCEGERGGGRQRVVCRPRWRVVRGQSVEIGGRWRALTTLSAYFMTSATSMPPRDTCAARGVDARRAEERCGGVGEVQRGGLRGDS